MEEKKVIYHCEVCGYESEDEFNIFPICGATGSDIVEIEQ